MFKQSDWERRNHSAEFIDIANDDLLCEVCRRLISKIKVPSKLIGDAKSDKSSLSQIYINTYFQKLLMQDVMGFAYILNPKTKGGLGMMGSDLEDTYEDEENEEVIRAEFQDLVAEPGAKYEALFNSESFNPRTWWLVHGRNKFPLLSKLACKIFAIPTSSASSERVLSLIHTKKRCRLKNETVSKLAYVYINSQLVVGRTDEDADIDYFLQQVNGEEFTCIEDDDSDA